MNAIGEEENTSYLKFTEGKVFLEFEQDKGILRINSGKWQFETLKLKKEEDYRLLILLNFSVSKL